MIDGTIEKMIMDRVHSQHTGLRKREVWVAYYRGMPLTYVGFKNGRGRLIQAIIKNTYIPYDKTYDDAKAAVECLIKDGFLKVKRVV